MEYRLDMQLSVSLSHYDGRMGGHFGFVRYVFGTELLSACSWIQRIFSAASATEFWKEAYRLSGREF